MPGYGENKGKKRLQLLSKNAAPSHFLWTDRRTSLSFMRQINIFTRISAILQPRNIAAVYVQKTIKEQNF